MRITTLIAAVSVSLAMFPRTAAAQVPPVQLDSIDNTDMLQVGNANDAYWVDQNPWGAGATTEGPAPDQYQERIGVYPSAGPNGEVAFRLNWRWPASQGDVRAYMEIMSGRKPGLFATNNLPAGQAVRLTDGTISQKAPSGDTPGTFLPMQLPVPPVTATFARSHVSPPTGRGQLTFDIWLQSAPGQDQGFSHSSITHEIMIPLENYGGYGAFPNGRPQQWYDHDATIDGRLYHVYATKDADGQLTFDFNLGLLDGTYGRRGWKMIVFEPDAPIPDGQLNIASFVNYLATRTDSAGTPWATGTEYLSSVELGVEPAEGTGDLIVYNYKVSASPPSPPPPPPPPQGSRIQAEAAAFSGTGASVRTDVAGYEGSGFVGPFSADGDSLSATFSNVAAGSYDINIRYNDNDAFQANTVAINGAARSEGFPASGAGWAIMTIPGVSLPAGTNVISFVKEWGWTNIDYIEIVPAVSRPSSSTPTHIQAEDGTLSGSGISINTDAPGFEGTGFVGPFSQAGDQVAVTFPNVAAGTYSLNIRYQSGTQQNTVVVNGVSQSETFPDTGGAWAIKTISGVSLAQGANVVAIAKDWGAISIDYIEIAGGGGTTAMKLQAETGSISGTGVAVTADVPGYEGTGLVGPFSDAGDQLSLSFANVTAGRYDINLRYNNGAFQANSVVINGAARSEGFPASGAGWAILTIPGVSLQAGTNVISMVKEWGWTSLDYVEIVPAATRPSSSTPTHIQAEDGTLSGSGIAIDTDTPGYEGEGFVAPFSNPGDQVSVTFPNVTAGTYSLNIRYQSATQQNSVIVNGAPQTQSFPDTGGAWAIKTITGVSLAAGSNVVAIAKDWGSIAIDYIEIGPGGP
jgi:hypothetical protein